MPKATKPNVKRHQPLPNGLATSAESLVGEAVAALHEAMLGHQPEDDLSFLTEFSVPPISR